MPIDRRRMPNTTRQETAAGNPDPNATLPIADRVAQPNQDPTRDIVPFAPQFPAGVNIGDPSTLGLDAVDWGMMSPNFSPGAAGWRIRSNGDAEFGALTARGNITGLAGANLLPTQFNAVTNQITNPGAEVNTTGWTAGASTGLARSVTVLGAEFTGTGAASFQLTNSGGVAAAISMVLTNPITGIVAGQTVVATAEFVTAVTSRSCHVDIQWFDAAHALLSTTVGGNVSDTTAAWQSLCVAKVFGVAPANAVEYKIQVVANNAAVAEVHFVDVITACVSIGDQTGSPFPRASGATGHLALQLGQTRTNTALMGGAATGVSGVLITTGVASDKVSTQTVAVTGGQTYRAVCAIKQSRMGSGTATIASSGIEFFDSTGASLGTVSTNTLAFGDISDLDWWTPSLAQHTTDFAVADNTALAPPTAVSARFHITFASTAGDLIYLDDFVIQAISVVSGVINPAGGLAGIIFGTSNLADGNTSTVDGTVAQWGSTVSVQLQRGRRWLLMVWLQGSAARIVTSAAFSARIQISMDNGGKFVSITPNRPTTQVGNVVGTSNVAMYFLHAVVPVETFYTAGVHVDTFPGATPLQIKVLGQKTSGDATNVQMQNAKLSWVCIPIT